MLATKKTNWQKRKACLQTLQSLASSKDYSLTADEWEERVLPVLVEPLALQLSELRSKLVIEACRTVTAVVNRVKTLSDTAMTALVEPLVSLTGRSKKCMQIAGADCLRQAMRHALPKSLGVLIARAAQDRNAMTRSASVDCMAVAAKCWPEDELRPLVARLRSALTLHLAAPAAVVRKSARVMFLAFKTRYPKIASQIHAKLGANVQRQLQRESEQQRPTTADAKKLGSSGRQRGFREFLKRRRSQKSAAVSDASAPPRKRIDIDIYVSPRKGITKAVPVDSAKDKVGSADLVSPTQVDKEKHLDDVKALDAQIRALETASPIFRVPQSVDKKNAKKIRTPAPAPSSAARTKRLLSRLCQKTPDAAQRDDNTSVKSTPRTLLAKLSELTPSPAPTKSRRQSMGLPMRSPLPRPTRGRSRPTGANVAQRKNHSASRGQTRRTPGKCSQIPVSCERPAGVEPSPISGSRRRTRYHGQLFEPWKKATKSGLSGSKIPRPRAPATPATPAPTNLSTDKVVAADITQGTPVSPVVLEDCSFASAKSGPAPAPGTAAAPSSADDEANVPVQKRLNSRSNESIGSEMEKLVQQLAEEERSGVLDASFPRSSFTDVSPAATPLVRTIRESDEDMSGAVAEIAAAVAKSLPATPALFAQAPTFEGSSGVVSTPDTDSLAASSVFSSPHERFDFFAVMDGVDLRSPKADKLDPVALASPTLAKFILDANKSKQQAQKQQAMDVFQVASRVFTRQQRRGGLLRSAMMLMTFITLLFLCAMPPMANQTTQAVEPTTVFYQPPGLIRAWSYPGMNQTPPPEIGMFQPVPLFWSASTRANAPARVHSAPIGREVFMGHLPRVIPMQPAFLRIRAPVRAPATAPQTTERTRGVVHSNSTDVCPVVSATQAEVPSLQTKDTEMNPSAEKFNLVYTADGPVLQYDDGSDVLEGLYPETQTAFEEEAEVPVQSEVSTLPQSTEAIETVMSETATSETVKTAETSEALSENTPQLGAVKAILLSAAFALGTAGLFYAFEGDVGDAASTVGSPAGMDGVRRNLFGAGSTSPDGASIQGTPLLRKSVRMSNRVRRRMSTTRAGTPYLSRRYG